LPTFRCIEELGAVLKAPVQQLCSDLTRRQKKRSQAFRPARLGSGSNAADFGRNGKVPCQELREFGRVT
jgi:hypothetical protein